MRVSRRRRSWRAARRRDDRRHGAAAGDARGTARRAAPPAWGWERSSRVAARVAQRGEDRGDAARLAVAGVLVREAVQLGFAGDVAFDEVDAVVVVDGYVGDGDAAVDALRPEGALAAGDAVARELDG